ncbi:DUF2752 domain-containing protein [Kitasatospora sp. NBC_00315]|uniref:DUF2752 domain-containing protein n=1 Tax=Kitasatospora sp. NBC_00315 TaxID=2975963 RepID=UPI003251CA58
MNAPAAPAPPTSALRRLGRPLAALAALAVPTGYVASVDPNAPGHYPTCPFLRATGWWCPGCGGLRCVHALSRGDLFTALHDNALVVGLAAVVAVLWLSRVRSAVRGVRPPGLVIGGRRTVLLAVLLVLFTVLRNLPIGIGLAPAAL